MQRRETLGSKEIQLAQIKDQPTTTLQMLLRVLGQSVSVGCVDAAVGPDDSYRRPEPTTGEPCGVTLPGLGKKSALWRHGRGGRNIQVVSDMRLTPKCPAGANALRGQRRTADPIPDWLRVSTQLTFHRAGAIVKSCGSRMAQSERKAIRVLLSGRRAFSLKGWRPNIIPVSPPEGPQSSEVGGRCYSVQANLKRGNDGVGACA